MAEWYEQILDLQLQRNRALWSELRERAAGNELRLGFIYRAPGEAEARALATFLREETDYEVDAGARPDEEAAGDEAWFVIGTTQPTQVSLELLDAWAEWMIAAGAAEGPCAFDGWAAQLVG